MNKIERGIRQFNSFNDRLADYIEYGVYLSKMIEDNLYTIRKGSEHRLPKPKDVKQFIIESNQLLDSIKNSSDKSELNMQDVQDDIGLHTSYWAMFNNYSILDDLCNDLNASFSSLGLTEDDKGSSIPMEDFSVSFSKLNDSVQEMMDVATTLLKSTQDRFLSEDLSSKGDELDTDQIYGKMSDR